MHRRSCDGRALIGLLAVVTTCLVLSAATISLARHVSSTRTRDRLAQVEKDFAAIRRGVISFSIDWCGAQYPPDTSMLLPEGTTTMPLTFELSGEAFKPDLYSSQTVAGIRPTVLYVPTLTTPVPYLKDLPTDPFRDGRFYGYISFSQYHSAFPAAVLHSPGPDLRDDVSLWELRARMDAYMQTRRYGTEDPYDYGYLRELIKPYLYDPTNGLVSSGDLLWVFTNAGTYGWSQRDKEWEDAPIPPFASGEAATASAPVEWRDGDPIPAPATPSEYIEQNRLVTVPDGMADVLTSAGILLREPTPRIREDLFAFARNQVGRMPDFFTSPTVLSNDQVRFLAELTREQPNWWRNMEPLPVGNSGQQDIRLPANQLNFVLPVYGKSQLLMAAREAALTHVEQALERITTLQAHLSTINYRGEESPERYERRIHTELHRLCRELSAAIKAGQTGPTDRSPKVDSTSTH